MRTIRDGIRIEIIRSRRGPTYRSESEDESPPVTVEIIRRIIFSLMLLRIQVELDF